MSDVAWAVPTALAIVGALLVTSVVVMVVRTRRRSPRMRAAADAARLAAADALLRLDDAATELDVAFEAADAVVDGDSTSSLRRGRAAALRARDRGFVEVAALETSSAIPAQRRIEAEALRVQLEAQFEKVARTRAELVEWAHTHGAPSDRVRAARARRDDVVRTAGDPAPLIASLRERFDESDWHDAAEAADAAAAALAHADETLAAADAATDGGEIDRLVHEATDATRRTARHLKAVEDAHRIALQAADNADAELAAAREELAAAIDIAGTRPDECAPDAAARLREATNDLDAAAVDARKRPRAAIETVARVRELRDELLGEAPGPRRRLEAARAALPGTLACARAALAAAEARDDRTIDARLRRDRARRELAAARAATDAGVALANARKAWQAAAAR
ncbi:MULTISPECIES: hypothetical protein [Microbacterium]|uniref:hypothetical protein n=1 Tax=Microbacterium TaxID=33882 RepID=UPI0023DB3907|nr:MULTISPECIES: hypothetical protein [Microbacterium]MDF2046562.1 hypothetical protein [Microbacterium sp. Kw_RZR3]MDQ1074944.1 hypothetical protein [Microbacterium sp. SORGH_AS_0969]MDQ1115170.1 hypothetical protein [Microbacterium testaceum]